jgi:hypothetical protein
MHRESRPRPRSAPLCAYCQNREPALEPADRHALRLGIAGHVECRRRIQPPPSSRRGVIGRRLAYAALIASPLIELAASAGWSNLPGAPLSTIAA